MSATKINQKYTSQLRRKGKGAMKQKERLSGIKLTENS